MRSLMPSLDYEASHDWRLCWGKRSYLDREGSYSSLRLGPLYLSISWDANWTIWPFMTFRRGIQIGPIMLAWDWD